MKKAVFVIFFLILSLVQYGQNLVRNPGMDSTNYCPTFLGDVGACQYWINATGSTPDYFHLCQPGLAPSNAAGWQMPHSDSAYLGFASYVSPAPNSREYIAGQLLTPLDSGIKYCVEMYLSLCDICEAAAGPIGIYFSDTLISLPLDSGGGSYLHYLDFVPQLEFAAVTDTANWVLVNDTFTASGGELFFVIGNFRTGANTEIDTLFPFTLGFGSYYYIDDVSVKFCDDTTTPPPPPPPVEPISTISVPNVFTPNGDNVNDDFRILTENLSTYSLEIYNRWGVQVFTTIYSGQFWDGRTTSGSECSDGTYYYIIRAIGEDNKQYLLKGFVTLIR
jgi:gliding motility-associated-like protein